MDSRSWEPTIYLQIVCHIVCHTMKSSELAGLYVEPQKRNLQVIPLRLEDSFLDETNCCGRFLRCVVTCTFCSVFMSLSTLVFWKPTCLLACHIYELLEQFDKRLFNKARANVCHSLYPLLPGVKDSSLRLWQRTSQLPKINTERFKNSFVNRLYFRYKLIA